MELGQPTNLLHNFSIKQETPGIIDTQADVKPAPCAESQQAVRELRRPGGGKPHGQVRSMTIPAGGQVCITPPPSFYLTNILLQADI